MTNGIDHGAGKAGKSKAQTESKPDAKNAAVAKVDTRKKEAHQTK